MKKSFMSNIMNFVDSNVRQRIDRVAHNNNEFFSDDLLTLERHFEDIRQVCVEAEKRISAMLQSIQSTPSLGAYTQNVQVGFNNLSQNIAHVASGSGSTVQPQALPAQPATGGCVANINSNLKCIQQTANKSSNNLVTGKGESSSTFASTSSTTATAATSKPSTSEQTANHRFNNDDGISNITNGSHLVSNSPIDLIDPAQQLTNDIQQRHKKLPIVGFLKFLVKSCHKLKPDSLLATTLTHCSQLQIQLTKLYLAYEQTIELQCLRPVQHMLEIDVPNVVKLRKLFIKSHNDLESLKAKYNGVSQKQLQQQQHQQQQTGNSYTIAQTSAQQSNINKLDQLKKDTDDAVTRFEQARDTYEAELYSFVCRESEIVDLLRSLYKYQAEYHQQVIDAIQGSLPTLDNILVYTPRKVVFGVQLDEHLRCTGQVVSPVIELCTHLLYSQGLKEEGLFRIPGSSVKIKKLKNAINAWFVTLASRQELESDQQRQSGHSNIVALYDLFKNILGHGRRSAAIDLHSLLPTSTVIPGVGGGGGGGGGGGDESTLTKDTISNNQPTDEDLLTFDLHSIAGLLKLYLRELPEPLISHSLYDQWLAAVSMTTNEEKLNALSDVIQQMPKANYNNLRHLIRFLHLLTCHQEHNKMSSSNLAITMAPSLIWSKPASAVVVVGGPPPPPPPQQPEGSSLSSSSQSVLTEGCDGAHVDDTNTAAMMNLHMSSIGMSASLHALVLEALINYAESLFPGQVDFTLAPFKELTNSKWTSRHREQGTSLLATTTTTTLLSKNRDRSVKSTSPTGISTASSSSSSFSSTASVSTSSSARPTKPTHSRKSGSMDGLLNHSEPLVVAPTTETRTMTTTTTTSTNSMNRATSASSSSRPMSVHLQAREFCSTSTTKNRHNQQQQQPPPPVPPVPLVRSHGRYNAPDQQHQQQQQLPTWGRSNLKPPAPPVPQQPSSSTSTSSTREHEDNGHDAADTTFESQKPRAASLRGTGSISSAPNAAPLPVSSNSTGGGGGGGGGSSNLNSVRRPTVPPPDRPPIANSITSQQPQRPPASAHMDLSQSTDHHSRKVTTTTTSIRPESDGQSSRSVTSGGGGGGGGRANLKCGFEEITSGEVDEIDITMSRPDSAVVWPDSNSGGDDDDDDDDDDDSSFDDANDQDEQNQHDNQSPDHSSWIDCGLTTQSGHAATGTTTTTASTARRAFNHPTSRSSEQQTTGGVGASNKNDTECDENTSRPPPVKPPRTTSPKITQSTPL